MFLSYLCRLLLNIKIQCDGNFFGEECDVFCLPPRPNSGEHYSCDRETGEMVCHDGKLLTHLPLDKMAAILADDIFKCIFLNESDKITI